MISIAATLMKSRSNNPRSYLSPLRREGSASPVAAAILASQTTLPSSQWIKFITGLAKVLAHTTNYNSKLTLLIKFTVAVRPIVYRNGRIYTKKLFTPPLGYYECLERMLEKCHVQRLIFHAFTFTDLFVEKLFEYKTKEYLADIDAVVIHGWFTYNSRVILYSI